MTPILTVAVPRRIVPYVRSTRNGGWKPNVRRYHESQERLWLETLGVAPGIRKPLTTDQVRVGVAVFFDPVKSGPNKGGVPANKGDWDNYYKAVVDCLVHYGALVEDNASRVAGPSFVEFDAPGLAIPAIASPCTGLVIMSGCYLRPEGMVAETTAFTVWA